VINTLLYFKDLPDVEQVKLAIIKEWLSSAEMIRMRSVVDLSTKPATLQPLEVSDLDMTYHFQHRTVSSEAEVIDYVQGLLPESLDKSKPLWQFVFVRNSGQPFRRLAFAGLLLSCRLGPLRHGGANSPRHRRWHFYRQRVFPAHSGQPGHVPTQERSLGSS